MNIFFGKGFTDLKETLFNLELPFFLAKSDIKQRYRRSSLGPFWITISMAVNIACIGIIFGNLFKAPLQEFFPFLTAGLIIWGFISVVLTESTSLFSSCENIIRQLPLPLSCHLMRMILRNLFIFFHNLIVLPLVLIIVKAELNLNYLLFIPGLLLLTINLSWMSLIIGIVCARFRDISQILMSVLQIFFYLTPIIWLPSLLPARTSMMVLDPNPFYHLMQLVRSPLLGQAPSLLNWSFCLILCILGWFVTLIFFNKYRGRIAYWL